MSIWKLNYDKKNHHAEVAFLSSQRFDDILVENDKYVLLLEGVILNSEELCQKYERDEKADLFIGLLDEKGHDFPRELRGCFTGGVYDKTRDELFVFANQTGDTATFYCDTDEWFFASNYLTDKGVLEALRQKHVSYTYNEQAAKYILSYGFMIDDSTFFNEINRVMPGYCIVFNGLSGEAITKQYHRFSNHNQSNMSIEEAVELVENGFKKAVKRCFDKDNQYQRHGEKEWHLADMSAGLDSRMTTWVAKRMGYKNIVNICYAQSNSQEEKLAGQVATYLGNDFYFKYLDASNFIYSIDEIVQMNYGQSYYAASTGCKDFLGLINHKEKLEHSGQIGDVVIGSFAQEQTEAIDRNQGRYSLRLGYQFEDSWYTKDLDNKEMFCMYTRAFLGALSSHLIRRNYNYTVSPFIDVDFMETCLSIPTELRAGHKVYFAWLKKYYPDVFEVKSTRDKVSLAVRVKNKGKRELRKMLYHMKLISSAESNDSMNPFEYWYCTNRNIREFIERYYNENIERCKHDSIFEDIIQLYEHGNVIEKLQVLTVLSVKKQFF